MRHLTRLLAASAPTPPPTATPISGRRLYWSECYDRSVSNTQFLVTIALAPAMSLVIVLAGYIVQNNNLNARTSELRNELKDLLRAELGAIRAEMARNNSELLLAIRAEMARNQSEILGKLAELDRRISPLEVRQ